MNTDCKSLQNYYPNIFMELKTIQLAKKVK